MALLWLVMAFRTKPTLTRQGGTLRLGAVLVVAALVVTPRLQGASLHRLLWSPSLVVSTLALLTVAGGAAVGVWARFTIGANWSGAVTFKVDHELVQSGPYHYVRHPIYSALLLMTLGTALDYAQLFGFIVLGMATLVLVVKMRFEEKLMTEHFAEQYDDYRRHVKALIPFIV
jgi:protein-S-isoprenylcysteine O-methyltransferase Ste14